MARSSSAAPEGAVEGVAYAGGTPCPEATVLVASGPDHVDLAALTGPDGRFSLGGLRPGRYEVLVQTEDGRARRFPVEVADGEVVHLDCHL